MIVPLHCTKAKTMSKTKKNQAKADIASQEPIRNKTVERVLLIFTLIASAFLINSTMDTGHAWGGDFALYIEQAMAFNNGSLDALYEDNKYSMDNSPEGFGPYLYPMGFSLLLSPVISVFGYDLMAMKWLCALCLLLGVFFTGRLFKDRFQHYLFPILIAAVIATHYQYTLFCDNVLSDLPFFACVMLCFLFMERAKSLGQLIGLGALIFFSYLIRDVGIFLLPALAVWQFMQGNQNGNGNGKNAWIQRAIPYLTFALLFILSKAIFPSGQENHLAQFFSGELTSNLGYYGEQMDKFLLVKEYDSSSGNVLVFRYLVLGLFLYGAFKSVKDNLHYLVFIGLSIVLYLLWPYTQGLRFLYPILPFVLFFAFKGLESVSQKVKVKNLALYIGIIICAFPIIRSINASMEQAPKTRDMVERPEIQEAFVFINENLPEDAVVGFHKPRVLRLYTGRNGVFHPFQQYAEVNADYILVLRTAEKFPLDLVYSNEAFLLFKNRE